MSSVQTFLVALVGLGVAVLLVGLALSQVIVHVVEGLADYVVRT